MFHKFNKSDIKFIDEKNKDGKYTFMDKYPQFIKYGIVGNFCADRCDPTDMFVIIDSYNKNQ